MRRNETARAYLSLCVSMLIFGSIGIFRKYLSVPSGFLALTRAVVGAVFLILAMALGKRRLSISDIKRNLWKLCVSGAFLGINWILLFEAYNNTSVSVATLCYYMAPVFIMIVSPFVLKERLTAKKALCGIGSLFGMILVSGIVTGGALSGEHTKGILFGLASAVFYASVVVINKTICDISPYDKTFVQLAVSAAVMLPYVLLVEDVSSVTFDLRTVILLAVVGIVHTGVAYALYFGALKTASAQSAAICSYVDPASALILSAVVLGEKLDAYGIIGAVMILVFAALGEISLKKNTP